MLKWRLLITGWIVAMIMIWVAAIVAHGAGAFDRPCTQADVARFEALYPRGYHSDPRMQMTLHYLGTKIVNGTCLVAIRPAS